MRMAPARLAPEGPSPFASRQPTKDCGFAINGRFYTQATTGVQRYAREITRAIDRLLGEQNRTGTVVLPVDDVPLPILEALTVRRLGPLASHAWEQAVLPLRTREPLLNLCNTAPVLRRDQVVCIHDANVFIQPESYGAAFRYLYRGLQPALARRAMRIASVSRTAAQQLSEHLPIKASAIAVLPNGHEHALQWRSAASTLFRDDPMSRPFVLLLGSRAKHKNADLILGLADALDARGLDLVVAGGQAGIFAALAESHAANIRWLGVVSDDDLALLFSTALCLAFPSFTEGFGLPIVEAMALGCPVVSSDRASMPEICGSAALLASPTDASAWLAHITRLRDSVDLRQDLVGRGHQQVRLYSWAASARGYLDMFDV